MPGDPAASAVQGPLGRFQGALAAFRAPEPGAAAINAAVAIERPR